MACRSYGASASSVALGARTGMTELQQERPRSADGVVSSSAQSVCRLKGNVGWERAGEGKSPLRGPWVRSPSPAPIDINSSSEARFWLAEPPS